MFQGRTLVELATEIERQKASKRDFVVPSRGLAMEIEKDKPLMRVAESGLFPLRDYAHGQVAARLDIPKKYYDRMKAAEPTLLAHNVNVWLGKANENRMVRTLDGQVRALLSDRYQRIENEEIAEVALPILMDVPDMKVASCEVTERNLYIKAVFPRLEKDVKVGQTVQAGVIIKNSEVGSGAAGAYPFFMTLQCLNGMTSYKEGVRRNHVGRRVSEGDENYEIYADDTREADDRAILLKFRDLIRSCTDELLFSQRIDKMRETTERRLEGDVVKAVELLAKKQTFNELEKASVLRHLIDGGDLSQWGVISAVTRAAQDAVDYERATEMEIIGGRLLDLPATEWRELAMAA